MLHVHRAMQGCAWHGLAKSRVLVYSSLQLLLVAFPAATAPLLAVLLASNQPSMLEKHNCGV